MFDQSSNGGAPAQISAIDFDVETVVHAEHVLVRLTGELDNSTAPHLRSVLERLSDSGPQRLVFEMSDLEFIDSSGMHELVVALRRQRSAGGEVVLRAPRPHTRRVLDIVGLSEIFIVE